MNSLNKPKQMENGKQPILDNQFEDNKGLTKREYFAGLATQGWIACQHDGFTGNEDAVASRAVKYADALLAELEKPKSK